MNLTAQTLRTVLASLVVCLAMFPAIYDVAAQTIVPEERPKGSIIRGLATYADTGNPVRHASVHLIGNGAGIWHSSGITDGNGRFVLENVPAGSYIVYVYTSGILVPERFSRNMGPASAQLRLVQTRDLFTEVVVNGTDSVDVKISSVRGGVITGRVVTEDDQPVPGADVKLLKRENDKWLPVEFTWSSYTADKKLRTDPSGVYRVPGLEAGEYVVRVSEPSIGFDGTAHDDEAYGNGSQMVTYHPAATNIEEAQPVPVIEGSETTGVDVRMPDRIPRTISGAITIGKDDAPAGFAEVRVERPEEVGFSNEMFEVSVRADSEGKWELRGVPAGEYIIRFGGTALVGTSASLGHIYVAPKEVRVTVSHEDVVLNTNLSAAAVVEGSVKFDGPPMENLYELTVGFILAGDKSELPSNNQGRIWKRGYSAGSIREQSNFQVEGLGPGKHWFVVSGFPVDRYYVKSVTRKGADLSQKPLKLEAGTVTDGIVVTLSTDLASIEGQLSGVTPKSPADGVLVIIAPANDATRRFSLGLRTVQPDAQGKFVLNCAPGEYFLVAFTRAQREKLTAPITEDYFKHDKQKFLRVKVKAGEKMKGLTLPLGVDSVP